MSKLTNSDRTGTGGTAMDAKVLQFPRRGFRPYSFLWQLTPAEYDAVVAEHYRRQAVLYGIPQPITRRRGRHLRLVDGT